jgi:hypothetical protein
MVCVREGNLATEGPLESPIAVAYNRGDIVGQAIESILGKTYKNIEDHVLDDGRPMAPTMFCGGSATESEWRGRKMRGREIEVGSGELIAFQDSNDTPMPAHLKRQVKHFEKAGPRAR